jgi:DNA-binding MarR family transcriptional regulator
MDAVEQILVCCKTLRAGLADRAAGHGLTDAQLLLLWACFKASGRGVGQQELSQTHALSPAHVSGLVEQLRDRGLLEGERSPTDRRRQSWRITPLGADVVGSFIASLTASRPDIDALLADTGWRDVRRLIGRLAEIAAGPSAETRLRLVALDQGGEQGDRA